MAAFGERAAEQKHSYSWRALARRQCRGRRCLSAILVKAFTELGYVDGKNIHLDQRFPAENPELFRKLGQELVDAHPAVLIAITTIGAVTLKKLTSSIRLYSYS